MKTPQVEGKSRFKRGWTKFGYPIVWKKKLTHEQCLERLKEKGLTKIDPVKEQGGKTIKEGKVGGIKFRIWSTDLYNINLTTEGHTTYHRDLVEVAQALRRSLEKRLIQDEGTITSLAKLVVLAQHSHDIIEKAFK